MPKPLWYVHVNKHKIRSNIGKPPEDQEPPIRIQRGLSGDGQYCMEVELPPNSRMIYSPDKPILGGCLSGRT